MAIDFASDLDAIFDTDELAQTATYIRQGYASAQIPVIFDEPYLAMQGPGLDAISTSTPSAICRKSDVPFASRGDRLDIGGKTFYVIESRPDGDGVTILFLSREEP
jgi:hypothetical protein